MDMRGMQDTMAGRAYAYRIFHIVFGADPGSEMLRLLAGDMAQQALSLFNQGAVKQALALCTDLAAHANDEQLIEGLRQEHDRALVLPGPSYVHPWESPYVGKETMLFQPSTLDVRARYAAYGYIAKDKGHFPEDHVSMMCDFLAELALRTHDACARAQAGEVSSLVADQAAFIETHMLTWLSKFSEKFAESNAGGFYTLFAAALLAFVTEDRAYLLTLS